MKTKPKHTSEPWNYVYENKVWEGYHEPFGGDFEITFQAKNEATAKRIVDCVNACKGIENPQIIKTALKEMFELIEFWQQSQNKEGWSSDEEDAIIKKYGSIIKNL